MTDNPLAALHRSFPEAGDGRPLPPMGDELMTAGLNAEDARFVAVQLAQNGLTLVDAEVMDRIVAEAEKRGYDRGFANASTGGASAALTLPDMDEAGKVLETLKFSYVLTMPRHCAGAVAVSAQSLSDLITRLLAQRAADAERIRGLEEHIEGTAKDTHKLLVAAEDRIAALTAQVERMRGAVDYILDGMGISAPDYSIDADDDFQDAANSEWVRDTLTRLAAAITEESQ